MGNCRANLRENFRVNLRVKRRLNPRRIVIIVIRLERGRRRYESDNGGHEAGRWRDENSGLPRRSVGAMAG